MNLKKDVVKRLDLLADFLMLDTNYWLYSARTRLNDETGHTINAIFHGENIKGAVTERHKIHAHYPSKFSNDFFIDNNNQFMTSLEVKFSPNVASVLKQKYIFRPKGNEKAQDTLLGFFD